MKNYVIAMSYAEEMHEAPEVYFVKAENEDDALIYVFKEKKAFTTEEIDYLFTGEIMEEAEDETDFEINIDFLNDINYVVKCLDDEKFDEAPEI